MAQNCMIDNAGAQIRKLHDVSCRVCIEGVFWVSVVQRMQARIVYAADNRII